MYKTESILEELYRLEPELRKESERLEQIITLMIAERPNPVLNDQFRLDLATRLDREIARMSRKSNTSNAARTISLLLSFLLGGAAFASLMVASPLGQYMESILHPETKPAKQNLAQFNKTIPEPPRTETESGSVTPIASTVSDSTTPIVDSGRVATVTNPTVSTKRTESNPVEIRRPITKPSGLVAFGVNIRKTAPGSFGVMDSPASVGGGGESMKSSSFMATTPVSSPESTNTHGLAPMADTATVQGVSNRSTEPVQSRYIYAGKPISIPATLPVLKKETVALTDSTLASMLSGFRFSLFDTSALQNANLDTLTLSEDREYGYQVMVDAKSGIINVSKNWARWPDTSTNSALTLSDVPSDAVLIEKANAFIKQYRVDLAHYGKPEVNTDWRTPGQPYVPDTISVLYPLSVDGREVYESYGQKRGITISVDIRSGRVAEISGAEKLDFLASGYSTDTDLAHLLALANSLAPAPELPTVMDATASS